MDPWGSRFRMGILAAQRLIGASLGSGFPPAQRLIVAPWGHREIGGNATTNGTSLLNGRELNKKTRRCYEANGNPSKKWDLVTKRLEMPQNTGHCY